MIDLERWAEARRLRRVEDLSISAISRRLRLARKTVRRALRADRPPGRQLPVGKPSTSPRETLIDAFKDDVKRYLAECADLSAVQIHRRLVCERQFRGSVYVVRRYVRTLRERKRRAFLHLAYLPGECARPI